MKIEEQDKAKRRNLTKKNKSTPIKRKIAPI